MTAKLSMRPSIEMSQGLSLFADQQQDCALKMKNTRVFSKREVRQFLSHWGKTVLDKDLDATQACYHEQSVLWGTLAQEFLQGPENIRKYFISFSPKVTAPVEFSDDMAIVFPSAMDLPNLPKDKQARECSFYPLDTPDAVAIVNGSYIFYVNGQRTPARFTYVVTKSFKTGKLHFLSHHSSLFPPKC